MSPETLTAFGATLISAIALIVLPLIFRRQAAAQAKADREILAAQAKADRDAIADAARTSSDALTMDTINKAIASERDDLRIQILALQDRASAEIYALKQRTDIDLDRANKQIRDLADEVLALRRGLLPPMGGPAKSDS